MGFYVHARSTATAISIVNSGDVTAVGDDEFVAGIRVEAVYGDSPISIVNSGALAASQGDDNFGIFAITNINSPITIENSGDIASTTSVGRAYGIFALGRSATSVENSGDMTLATSAPISGSLDPNAVGIGVVTFGSDFAPASIENSGAINAASDYAMAAAILANTNSDYSPVSIEDSGNLTAISHGFGYEAYAIVARSNGINSPIQIFSAGDLRAISVNGNALGIYVRVLGGSSPVGIENTGDRP